RVAQVVLDAGSLTRGRRAFPDRLEAVAGLVHAFDQGVRQGVGARMKLTAHGGAPDSAAIDAAETMFYSAQRILAIIVTRRAGAYKGRLHDYPSACRPAIRATHSAFLSDKSTICPPTGRIWLTRRNIGRGSPIMWHRVVDAEARRSVVAMR